MKCIFLMVAVCTVLATGFIAKAGDKDARRGNSRQTTELFLDAALNGRHKEAAAIGVPGSAYSREEKIKEFGELNIKSLALDTVHADAANALAITAVVKGDHNRDGPLVISLVKKDDAWWVRDVDLASKESAKTKLETFLKAHPDAKPVPDASSK